MAKSKKRANNKKGTATTGKNESVPQPKKQNQQRALPDAIVCSVKDNTFPVDLLHNGKLKQRCCVESLHDGVIWVMHNFLDRTECQGWIDYAEKSNHLEHTSHPASRYVAHRECYRMQKNDEAMATKLFQRLLQQQQQQQEDGNLCDGMLHILKNNISPPFSSPKYVPIGFNPNLRLYKYTQGMSFGKHVDGSNKVDGMGKTEITVLIYLSECSGGATRFYPIDSSRKKNKKCNNSIAFQPEVGAMLLHVHGDRCLEHEADIVNDGVKYVLRTDVIYSMESGQQ